MFRMSFKTWENDGDYYQDKYLLVKTKADKDFLSALANEFRSKNSVHRGLGNAEHSSAKLVSVVESLLKLFPDVSEDLKDLYLDEDVILDNLYDTMLGDPVEYDYNFCRVMESVESREIVPGTLLQEKYIFRELVFVKLLDNGRIQVRKASHPLIDGVPDITRVEWILKDFDFDDVNLECVGYPNEASKLVASL